MVKMNYILYLLQDGEHETSIYSDSREKYGDDWVELEKMKSTERQVDSNLYMIMVIGKIWI